MTTKGQDPRTDQPTDDDTTGHASRYGYKAMPTENEPETDETSPGYKAW